jgi:hypothetical protein
VKKAIAINNGTPRNANSTLRVHERGRGKEENATVPHPVATKESRPDRMQAKPMMPNSGPPQPPTGCALRYASMPKAPQIGGPMYAAAATNHDSVRVMQLTLLLSRRACTTSCTIGFCNPACYHAPMKSDLRISIKDYHRNKNLKIQLVHVHSLRNVRFWTGFVIAAGAGWG